jgi:hypothetical protein
MRRAVARGWADPILLGKISPNVKIKAVTPTISNSPRVHASKWGDAKFCNNQVDKRAKDKLNELFSTKRVANNFSG